MPVDIKALTRNKWAMGGVAVAAGAGAWALYQRHKSGSSTSTADSSGVLASPAGVDTTGTDLAGYLGSFSEGFGSQMDDYMASLQDILDALQKQQEGATPPDVTALPVPKPSVPKTSPSSAQYVTVAKYTTKNAPWNSTLSGIAAHYKTSVSALMKLNPGVKNANVIQVGQKIRVR